jgi:hypothetical protein
MTQKKLLWFGLSDLRNELAIVWKIYTTTPIIRTVR